MMDSTSEVSSLESLQEHEKPKKPVQNYYFILPLGLACLLAIAPHGNTLLMTEIDRLQYDIIETAEQRDQVSTVSISANTAGCLIGSFFLS